MISGLACKWGSLGLCDTIQFISFRYQSAVGLGTVVPIGIGRETKAKSSITHLAKLRQSSWARCGDCHLFGSNGSRKSTVQLIAKTYCETSSKSKWGGRASSWKSCIAFKNSSEIPQSSSVHRKTQCCAMRRFMVDPTCHYCICSIQTAWYSNLLFYYILICSLLSSFFHRSV